MGTLKRLFLLTVLSFLSCAPALSEVVVVVNPKSGVEHLSRDEAVNIFLGRYHVLPTGIPAVPVDQALVENLRADFYRQLVDKSLADINAYWARLHFSGKATRPIQAASSAEAITRILGSPGGIGYLERAQVDSRVRVVLSLDP